MTSNQDFLPQTLISRSSEPAQAELDGEVVMMSLEQGNYYGLDPIGSRIWELLQQPTTMENLIDRLMGEYSVDQATCEKETNIFLTELLDHHLITLN